MKRQPLLFCAAKDGQIEKNKVLTKAKSRYSIKTSQRKHTKQVGELGGN